MKRIKKNEEEGDLWITFILPQKKLQHQKNVKQWDEKNKEEKEKVAVKKLKKKKRN